MSNNKSITLFLLVFFNLISGFLKAQNTQNVSTSAELLALLSDIEDGTSAVDNIVLNANTYNLTSSINLTDAHNELTISGCDGVYVNGGVVLDAASFVAFSSITSPGFTLSNPSAASSIKVLNLSSVGLTKADLGSINWHALSVEDFETPSVLWLEGEKMDLARWPNKDEDMTTDEMIMPGNWNEIRDEMHGQISYYEILATGTPNSSNDGIQFSVHSSLNSKITSWNFYKTSNSEKLWTDGVFHSSWEWEYNKVKSIDGSGNITLEHGNLSPFSIVSSHVDKNPPVRNVSSKSAVKPSHFYFENVPEEIDEPGEYFIDRDNMLLYFYPPVGWETKQLALSTLNDNMITIDNASNITIENLTLQSGLKNGIEINNCSDITIQNNVIRYFNQWGVRVLGTDNVVDNCELYGLGGGGVYLGEAVNAYTLVEENNSVKNSTIHSFGWDQKSQVPGVSISGVANKAIGNEISDGPHFAVKLRHARACLVENNRIHDLPKYHHFDGGAIYLGLGLNFQNRENRINNNYLYNIPTNGIYLDNYTSGSFAEGNVFYNVGNSTFNAASFAAIYNHGGGQNTYKDNIAVDCSVVIKTGSYIVKQGKAYRYLKSWMDAVAPGGPLEVGSAQYSSFSTQFVDSDIQNYMDMALNLPATVKSTIASVTGSDWPDYKADWDAIGYDATVGNSNPIIGSELQEWKNYFKLRYCESVISNNLGLYTDTATFIAKNTKPALTARGDNKLFWEFSSYENSHSNHIASNNEKYTVLETSTLFPGLVSNGALNESSYSTLSHSSGNLATAISHNLTLRGDVNSTTLPICAAVVCSDIGLDYLKYDGNGECAFSVSNKNTTSLEYEIDLTSGTDSKFINLSFLVNKDTGDGGMNPTTTSALSNNDLLIIDTNPNNEFNIVSVQHNWVDPANKYCTNSSGAPWSWNKRVDVRIEYTGNDTSSTHNVKLKFNPSNQLLSKNNERYCSQIISIDYKLNPSAVATWLGSTSSDWYTATNWDTGVVPTANTSVIIPSGKNPVIGAATGALVNDLTIDSNASLNITSGGSLIVGGTSTGNVTYNRALETTNWYNISSPLAGQSIAGFYTNETPALGSGTGNAQNVAIATYDNSQVSATDRYIYYTEGQVDGEGVDDTSDTFNTGIGYIVKLQVAKDVSFTGTVRTDDAGVAVTLTKGETNYNLIGNPYLAFINSTTFLNSESANLEPTFWIWNGSSYDTRTKGTHPNYMISPTQAFFVEAKTTDPVTFTEANQSHEVDNFQRSANSRPEIKLTLSNGSENRKTELFYIDGATTGFDNGFDGKMFGGATYDFTIYTDLVSNSVGAKYAVQSLPNSDLESMVIPVGVKAVAGKEITFTAAALNLPAGFKVFLEDRVTSTFTRLDEANSNYKVTLTEALNGIGRFYLRATSSALSVDSVALNSVSIIKSNNSTLKIAGLTQGKAAISLFNIQGKKIFSTSFEANGVKEVSLPKLATGVYVVELTTKAGKLSKKIILE